MSNISNDNKHNFVDFIRHHKPMPASAHQDLEQVIIDSLKPQSSHRNLNCQKFTKNLVQIFSINYPFRLATIAFLFTSATFCFRTSRIAIEPKDLENFLVKNWHDTLDQNSYTSDEEIEAYWLLPAMGDSHSSLSVSAQ